MEGIIKKAMGQSDMQAARCKDSEEAFFFTVKSRSLIWLCGLV